MMERHGRVVTVSQVKHPRDGCVSFFVFARKVADNNG